MHCDVLRPELPIAGFLLVIGLMALAGQRRPPRRRSRLFWGGAATLIALAVLTQGAVTTAAGRSCPAPPDRPETMRPPPPDPGRLR